MSLRIAELTATCNALGYAVQGENDYFLDKECKEAIRELIRFLRRDDEHHEIRRYLGAAGILRTDLIPILTQHYEDEELQDLLLRLLVNLTTPALLLYNEELPVDKLARRCYMEIIEHLQEFKQAFSKPRLWKVLCDKLSTLLKMDWADRGEEKSLIIVRILILVRNVLHVPTDNNKEKRADNDANMHDQVIWALNESGMMNLILYIASSESEKQYYFHVLEIISLMLRDQNAETLASTSVQQSRSELEREKQELISEIQKEQNLKRKNMMKYIAARHSRFGGTFVVRGVKSISDNDLIVHSMNKETYSSFDRHKVKLKTPKNRLPMQSETEERRSPFSVRVLMKEFCIEFLNGAYNYLMHYIREMFHRGKAQDNDESLYFWALNFFMEFNRYYKFEVKLISETMHVSIFHFTQERIEEWRARILMDKKKIFLWSKRMHLGLKAYRELLNTLFKMYQSQDHAMKESAHTIMSNIFYVIEYRELLLSLLNAFDEIKFSREYLKDLIEANHIFMKMLEHFCKRHRTLVVQKKAKKVRKRRSKQSKKKAVLTLEPSDEKWSEMEPRITDIFTNRIELNVQSMPFDAASDIPFEEQKVEAMRRIRLHLVKSEVEDAISLFRASREVWPENDCFGAAYMPPEEEVTALQEIFFTDIGFPAGANIQSVDDEDDEENSEGSGDEDEQVSAVSVGEQSFDFAEFVKKFARPKIAYACCLLLSQFEKNNVYTNHCILKLLHRITFDCKYAAILFQASVFRTFQRILNSSDGRHTELKQFAIYIVRKFTEVAQRNGKIWVEMLFWKTNKEAYEIEEGYGTLTTKSTGGKRKKKGGNIDAEFQDENDIRLEGENEDDPEEHSGYQEREFGDNEMNFEDVDLGVRRLEFDDNSDPDITRSLDRASENSNDGINMIENRLDEEQRENHRREQERANDDSPEEGEGNVSFGLEQRQRIVESDEECEPRHERTSVGQKSKKKKVLSSDDESEPDSEKLHPAQRRVSESEEELDAHDSSHQASRNGRADGLRRKRGRFLDSEDEGELDNPGDEEDEEEEEESPVNNAARSKRKIRTFTTCEEGCDADDSDKPSTDNEEGMSVRS